MLSLLRKEVVSKMLIIIFCIIIGTMIALFVPLTIPPEITHYIAIALLAGFDSIFGGLVAYFNENFKLSIFLSGFFGNTILAIAILYTGKLLNVDLSIAAIVVFGTRLFQNFATLRRIFFAKVSKKINNKKI